MLVEISPLVVHLSVTFFSYFVQLRRIDENRATLKRAKDLAKKSQSAKGSFYISSNSSSSSSLDYEIPIGLKDDISRYFVFCFSVML